MINNFLNTPVTFPALLILLLALFVLYQLCKTRFVVREVLIVKEPRSDMGYQFPLKHLPIRKSEELFVNGLLQEPRFHDYGINDRLITHSHVTINDRIRVSYRWRLVDFRSLFER